MKLPKSLTTVSTLSKVIAMVLFIALPFIGLLVGMGYQNKIDNIKCANEISKNTDSLLQEKHQKTSTNLENPQIQNGDNSNEELNKPTPTTLSTVKLALTSYNNSNNLYLILPENATVNNNEITINENIYIVNSRVGPGLCSMDEFDKSCGYIDEKTSYWEYFRIWSENSTVFALNPQSGSFNNVYADGLIITKKSPTTFFTEKEINLWKAIVDNLEAK